MVTHEESVAKLSKRRIDIFDGKIVEMNNFFKNIIIGLFSVRSNLTRVILTLQV